MSLLTPQLNECLEMVDASKEMWHEIVKAIDKKNGRDERSHSQQRLKTVLKGSKGNSQGANAPVWQNVPANQGSVQMQTSTASHGTGRGGHGLMSASISEEA